MLVANLTETLVVDTNQLWLGIGYFYVALGPIYQTITDLYVRRADPDRVFDKCS